MSPLAKRMASLIRHAAIGDAPLVGEIHVLACRQAYPDLVRDSSFVQLIATRREYFWRRWLSQANPGTLIVFEEDGALAGYCLFAAAERADGGSEPAGEIVSVAVRPEHWRRGLGRALCNHALNEAALRAWRRVFVWAMETGPQPRFCEALGFSPDGGRRAGGSLSTGPISEVRYRKSLSRP